MYEGTIESLSGRVRRLINEETMKLGFTEEAGCELALRVLEDVGSEYSMRLEELSDD